MGLPTTSSFPAELDTFLTDADMNGNTQDNVDGDGTTLTDLLSLIQDALVQIQELLGITDSADTDSIDYRLNDHNTSAFPHPYVPQFLWYNPATEDYEEIDGNVRIYCGTVAPDGSNGPYALGDVALELWLNTTVS